MTVALEGGRWSAARLGRNLSPGKTWCPFYRRLGGPQGRSGRAENPVPTGIFCKYTFIVPSVDKYNGYVGGNSVVWCVGKIVLVFRIRDNYCFVSHGPK